jgi:uncharacterized protein with WD repeat
MLRQSNAQIIKNIQKARKEVQESAGAYEASKARIAEFKKKIAEKKSTEKLPTEKRHKDDCKCFKGNIQKSRSDLHVNKKTGKREITTNMTINKGLTTKDKIILKKFIINTIDNTFKNNDIIKDDCIFEIELYYNELNNIIIKDVYIRDGMSNRVYDGIKESIALLLDE